MSPARLAIAIAAADTAAAMAMAQAAVGLADLVEYRLDGMGDFHLPALIAGSPLPAIITCRSRAQGGAFSGAEGERRRILAEAIALGAAFVDVEAEALPTLAFSATTALPRPHTRLIGSQHDFAGMMGDWASAGLRLRALGADIVKLVGMARTADDVLPPLAWLHGLTTPGIGLAMGAAGGPTRLLAPRFAAAFLSFAALDGPGTAPGQFTAAAMIADYGYTRLAAADPLLLLLTPDPPPWPQVAAYRAALDAAAPPAARPWALPLPLSTLTPDLLLALQLTGAAALACLPEVERDPALRQLGLAPAAPAYALRPDLAALPCADPPDLARRLFTPPISRPS